MTPIDRLAGSLLALALTALALPGRVAATEAGIVPPVASLQPSAQRMAPVIERYRSDHGSLEHFYTVPYGPSREAAFNGFHAGWQAQLDTIDFDALGVEDRIDWLLFRRQLARQLHDLEFRQGRYRDALALLPGVDELVRMLEQRRLMQPQDGRAAADTLARVQRRLAERNAAYREGRGIDKVSPVLAWRAAGIAGEVRTALKDWHGFYAGYDPQMSWWIDRPYGELDSTLETYAATLREKLAGAEDPETIIGDPIGRQALVDALAHEAIPYTPEELVAIARKELAWTHGQLAEAARALGYDDWRVALEFVKTQHPAPGEQPQLVVELAREAIDYLEERELVTIPELAKRDWRMNMLSPERQLQAPFFLGGADVWVAFPTRDMPHDKKLMSLRGNNRHFSRAVVHHELIPGHHLQHFMLERHRPYRQLYRTPFWGEGWALYWELRLWDLGFAQSPEQKIGMLFWRAHRAARILFSLAFHLGEMTPQQAIALLVEQVGHERENAAAEVRRSFAGDYGPLYQAAYLLGGLQLYALQDELVANGPMTDRQFHDAILQGGPMPIEFVRMRLKAQPPARDFDAGWRFYDRIEVMRRQPR